MRKAIVTLVWLLTTSLLGASLAAPLQAAPARQPTVVEFYTSQGCLACSAAGERVGDLADRKGLLVLSFSVDYWDYFGWPDPFAKPAFTERQRDYAQRLGQSDAKLSQPVTPQVIVQGRWQVAGGDADDVDTALAQAAKAPYDPPQMLLSATAVSVGSGRAVKGGAEVWLVRYDPHEVVTTVRRGENRGQVFRQRNVVKSLVRLGGWSGGRKSFTLPPADEPGLASAVLLQGVDGGRIIAAAASPLPKP